MFDVQCSVFASALRFDASTLQRFNPLTLQRFNSSTLRRSDRNLLLSRFMTKSRCWPFSRHAKLSLL